MFLLLIMTRRSIAICPPQTYASILHATHHMYNPLSSEHTPLQPHVSFHLFVPPLLRRHEKDSHRKLCNNTISKYHTYYTNHIQSIFENHTSRKHTHLLTLSGILLLLYMRRGATANIDLRIRLLQSNNNRYTRNSDRSKNEKSKGLLMISPTQYIHFVLC